MDYHDGVPRRIFFSLMFCDTASEEDPQNSCTITAERVFDYAITAIN